MRLARLGIHVPLLDSSPAMLDIALFVLSDCGSDTLLHFFRGRNTGENCEKVSYFEVGMANGKDGSDGGRGVAHKVHPAAGSYSAERLRSRQETVPGKVSRLNRPPESQLSGRNCFAYVRFGSLPIWVWTCSRNWSGCWMFWNTSGVPPVPRTITVP